MDWRRELVLLVRDNRGKSVVGLLLLLPLLLLLTIGITEFGRAWMTVNVMHAATGEGARVAAVTTPDPVAVEQRVTDVCASSGVTPTSVTVTGPELGDSRRRVTVSMTTDFEIFPGGILGETGTISLSASTTMRHESL